MSGRAGSASQWLRDSGLQVISALIGSSLLVTIITTLYAEINQPNVSLNVIPHYLNPPADIKEPKVDYYEIIVKNDGKKQATNMNLSMYFFGNISNPTPFFTGEEIGAPIVENVSSPQDAQIKGSLLRWDIPRLAPGAMIIFNVWTTATKFDPYYVTAIFDEGSKTYPVFGSADIESGRFPNILAGREDAQTIQRLLILFVVLCALFFTIAIAHKKIKYIIKKRSEGRKWEIEFDLFLALPITILSAILILYVCEEIPLSLLLNSVITPPLDVTDGPSIDTEVPYKTVNYKQGDLLLSAGIFWGISFFARCLLSYLIAKLIIKKLYKEKYNKNPIPDQFLASASIFIMGVPLASAITLFFSKSTYSISPVYLFFFFLVLDIIRMSTLVILIPNVSMKSNKLLNYGLNAISLVAGLLHLLLFVTLLKIVWITKEIESDFLLTLMVICLIGGLAQLTQMILIKIKEKARGRWLLAAASVSAFLIGLWMSLLYFITSKQDPMLSIGAPIVLIGIVTIVLNTSFIGLARLMDIRKINRVKLILSLDPLKTSYADNDNSCSKPCYPVGLPIPVTGQLKYDDSNGKVNPEERTKIIGGKTILFNNGESKVGDNSTSAETDKEGNLKYKIIAPLHVGSFEMHARFEGSSEWNSSRRPETQLAGKKNWKSEIFFKITVTPSANSRDNQENKDRLEYNTRLRDTTLSVLTGTMNKDGKFIEMKEFKPGELITFQVSLFDNDRHMPIFEGTNIGLMMLYYVDSQKVINLPPTNNEGKSYASILAPSIPSDGWIFQAYYTGDSVHAKATSLVQSYSTKVR